MPANRPPGARVWGNGSYVTSSFTCDAALHAGVITAEGGTFIVTIAGAQGSFAGGERNGVTSYPYEASQPSSLTFSPEGGATRIIEQTDRDQSASRLPAVEAAFVGEWRCTCKIAVVLRGDRKGSWVDGRGGPPGSMYESGTFTGTWSATATTVTLVIPPEYRHRSGTVYLTLVDGKLHDAWGGVYVR
jgi:hypothetical protein